MLNIVLVEPEIPQNTGNIARTCAICGARLHLIEPLGFSIDEKHVKRAGLDYWDEVEIIQYNNLDDFFERNPNISYYLFSTKAKKNHCQVEYEKDCYLLFGKETKGLPESLIFSHLDRAVRIPMRKGLRSLNLANSVAIATYEAMRQWGFSGLE